jgi:hypothetical protein
MAGRVRALPPAEAERQSPEGGNLRSLRTQQRAYGRLREVIEVPADESAVLTML